MRLYMAGSFNAAGTRQALVDCPASNILLSYGTRESWRVAEDPALYFYGGLHEIVSQDLRSDVRLFIAGVGNGQTNWDTVERGEVTNLLCSYAHETSKATANYFAPRGGYTKVILYCAGVPCSAMNRGWVLQAVKAEQVKSLLYSYAFADTRNGIQKFFEEHKEMILYLAGSLSTEVLLNLADNVDPAAKNFLESFASEGAAEAAVGMASQRFDLNIFIDSGAFTAWRMGTKIVLDEYMDFARGLIAKACCPLTFAGLDVIPGVYKGGPVTETELERCCQEGFDNYVRMRDAGLPCLPTFHRGDPEKWLDIIIDGVMASDSHYMCLAPKVDGSRAAVKMAWLNKCYRRIEERGLLADLKIHGLGVSSPIMMETYPFYSVDSTAWLKGVLGGSYRYWNGYRTPLTPQQEWAFTRTWCIDGVARHRGPGETDPMGEYGGYWYDRMGMLADTKLEKYITELWRGRGIVWEIK